MIPNITKTDYNYEGAISLESWKNIFPKKEDIFMIVGGDAMTDTLVPAHKKGYDYLVDNQEKVLNLIIKAIYNYYCEVHSDYEEYCPNLVIENEIDVIANILPEGVYIHNVEKDGISYIGYEFLCSWEEEHGVGIMLHKDSLIDIGYGDTAILSWIAREDLENS